MMIGDPPLPDVDLPQLARAHGTVSLRFARYGQATRVADWIESGCTKARMPRMANFGSAEAVLMNNAGGLTDGDEVEIGVTLDPGAAVTVSTASAEKIYRSRGAATRVSTSLVVGPEASLAWLPQETILFDRSRLDRRLRLSLSGSARFLGCESLVFGRLARGEHIRNGFVHDAWRVCRDGRLIWADAFRLDGDIDAALGRPALLDGRRAVATAIYAGDDAAWWLDTVRGLLPGGEVRAGVSHRPGLLVMRWMAHAAQALRAALASVLAPLRRAIGAGPAAMPRVWGC
jgi:urease accessory protein